jgi:hypothetical protein
MLVTGREAHSADTWGQAELTTICFQLIGWLAGWLRMFLLCASGWKLQDQPALVV